MSTTIGSTSIGNAFQSPNSLADSKEAANQQKFGNLFQQIDMYNTGKISKLQFEQAFNRINLPAEVKELGAEAAFKKMAPDHAEVITKKDFVRGLTSIIVQKEATEKQSLTKSQANDSKTNEIKPIKELNSPSQLMPTSETPKDGDPKENGWAVGYIINTTA